MKTCRGCREAKPLDAYSPHRPSADGRHPYCHPCRAAEARRRYAANPERTIAIVRRWESRHMERVLMTRRATKQVQLAVQRGDLVRPLACQQCGRTDRRIEGAHFDYSQPLNVRWLCQPCHRAWDRREPKTLRQSVELAA